MAQVQDSQKTGAGVGVALAALLALFLFGRKASGETPENGGEEPTNGAPGNGEPSTGEPAADFFMPPSLEVEAVPNDFEIGVGSDSYSVTFRTVITNRGDGPGTFTLTWGTNELHQVTTPEEFEVEGSRIVTLQPGESHTWQMSWPDIFDYYRGYFTCWLFASWSPDAYAIGVFQ